MTSRGAGLVLAAVALAALAPAVPAQQIFRSGTDLVLLTVTADNGSGVARTGLTQDQFQVFEDGTLQTISLFARDPQPISLSILIDSSSSMEEKIGVAREGATGFVRRLGPNDEAQIIGFNKDTEILQPFTRDLSQLEAAVARTRPGGSTSLYTAIYIALDEQKRAARARPPTEIRRQAIVVLSDGEDTASRLDYEDLIEVAKRSDVVIYAIALRDRRGPAARNFNESEYVLRTLSRSTGGRIFSVDEVRQLPDIYNEIADELANQYTVGYISTNTAHDGAWRQVSVRVAQPGVVARTRAGYYAPDK